ncbi:MAG: hypothetical protein D3910_01285 [Candidatus Electrothrix sp. ATG2]|nr:hypothetical protein [Candidatus Electrothrix sp. ATG2]
MKTILFLLLFIIIVPLLTGCFAERSVKSKNDLAPLATLAGILILFTLYLIFIDKDGKGSKEINTEQSPPTSAQPTDCNFDAACTHEGYSAEYQQKTVEQHVVVRENVEQNCTPPPAMECSCEDNHSPQYRR